MDTLTISSKSYSLKDFTPIFEGGLRVRLADSSKIKIQRSRDRLKKSIKAGNTIYGVNTGFGNLSKIKIKNTDQELLQLNLIKSHATGVGKPLGLEISRTVMVLKLLTYAKGFSGVRLELVEKIIQFINKDIVPYIPEKGSVGASGDLAPLAHLGLSLIGDGFSFYRGKKMKTATALAKARVKPIVLKAKEGISLINGTQVSSAIAVYSLIRGENLLKTADIVGAISVENSLSSRNVFRSDVHELKMHKGQRDSAKNIYRMLRGSQIVGSHKDCGKVQDPYSFRCIPHIHGACRDGYDSAKNVILNEINSVSDNPLVLESGEVISSGHFHGEHIAQSLDSLSIAFSELGAVSERRVYYFMKGIPEVVPPFVTIEPGLESGYMMAHVTASALASENKTLAHPASVDSLPTSGGQEDLVSMAPWAGYKLVAIQDNVSVILAIELMVASAVNRLGFSQLRPAKATGVILRLVSRICDFHKGDRVLNNEIDVITDRIIKKDITSVTQKILRLD